MTCRAGALALSCALLVGCPSPSTYGTPRTIPAGKDQHTVAFEGIWAWSRTASPDHTGTVMVPTYQYRRGASDTVDFGVRITNLSGVGGDVKWNFLRRAAADLAIDPGVQWTYAADQNFHVVFFHAPLLAGINLTPNVTFVLTPGLALALKLGSDADSAPSRAAIVTNEGVLARFGAGVNYRAGRLFSVMPEVTALRPFNASHGTIVVGGVGLKWGAQP
jgi:hypothetical protein